MLDDAPDLLARLRSLGDPSKATPTDQLRSPGSSVEPPAPIGADLLDAIRSVEVAVSWAHTDLSSVSNDLDTITYLGALLLDRHPPVDGIRPAWSVQDAVDAWGVERRDRNPQPWEQEGDEEEFAFPIAEWGDPMVTQDEAEELAGSARTLQRWLRSDAITPAGAIWVAGRRMRFFRARDVAAMREQMRDRQGAGLKQNRSEDR